MNTIVKAIFNEFAVAIAEKYSIEATPAELYVIWKQTIKSMTVTTSFAKPGSETESEDEVVAKKVEDKPVKKPAKKTVELEEQKASCPFAASRGPNMGKKCGKPAAKDTHMCSTHKKYADKYPEEEDQSNTVEEEKAKPSAVEEAKPTAAEDKPKAVSKGCDYVFSRGANKNKRCGGAQIKDSDFCSKHQKEADKPAKKDVIPKAKPVAEEKVIFANDGTHFVMRGARPLVCKSASEKIMIGKKMNGEIVPLDQEDIAFCKKLNLKYEEPASKKTLEELLDEVQGISQDDENADTEDVSEDDVEDEVEEELLEEDE
jgi:hypothetical protein